MSQRQPQRPLADQVSEREPVKYGDVFNVSGELASKPIAPRDAAAMQAAENAALGKTQRGGPAAVMQSAANINEQAGVVSHNQATDVARNQGVSVSEVDVGGNRFVREDVGGQVVGEYVEPHMTTRSTGAVLDRNAITIGEVLEATALSIGDKPVDQSDAAAIQAAEVRATGNNEILPGGVGATAQTAATHNTRTMSDGDKTRVSDVLADATTKLPSDKAVTREDAEGVIGAEIRNNTNMSTTPGGVAASMAAAARINQNI
ncbi:late embryogenesis abundant protein D-34 [Ziziphus jujuba]|uniref:Late embryogenesis abundant protein D-34 n=1 Tax=Ziziphus jujuba TaxID=326968 RepID=A0A6P4AR24_ZIZJJ|nr:late embryogenesis abundant protein D-34 [Ziziphus jujuba]